MAVPSFHDPPPADWDRRWDGDAAEKRVRKWAGARDEPDAKDRDGRVSYEEDKKENLGSYTLLVADVVDAARWEH